MDRDRKAVTLLLETCNVKVIQVIKCELYSAIPPPVVPRSEDQGEILVISKNRPTGYIGLGLKGQ